MFFQFFVFAFTYQCKRPQCCGLLPLGNIMKTVILWITYAQLQIILSISLRLNFNFNLRKWFTIILLFLYNSSLLRYRFIKPARWVSYKTCSADFLVVFSFHIKKYIYLLDGLHCICFRFDLLLLCNQSINSLVYCL